MSRLPMPSAMPAELAERMSDVAGPEVSEKELKEARDDLADKLLAGDRIGGVDLESLIDHEIDRNYAAFLRCLYEHFAGIASCEDSAGKCLDGDRLMASLVDKHLDAHPEVIEDRAAEIAAERLEDE